MAIIVNLDVMLAKRKMRSKELAERIGITEQNVSLLKSGKVKGVRFETLEKICEVLQCQPGDILEYRGNALAHREPWKEHLNGAAPRTSQIRSAPDTRRESDGDMPADERQYSRPNDIAESSWSTSASGTQEAC